LAAGAIADLVVVLRADHEPATGKMRGGSSVRTAAVLGMAARVVPALAKRDGNRVDRVDERRREIPVVALRLSGERGVERVVEIVGPGGVEPVAAFLDRLDDARLVEIALLDDGDGAALLLRLALHPLLRPAQPVDLRFAYETVHG